MLFFDEVSRLRENMNKNGNYNQNENNIKIRIDLSKLADILRKQQKEVLSLKNEIKKLQCKRRR